MLNAPEFIDMEIEDQGHDHLKIEFAIGDRAIEVASPLGFDPVPEGVLIGTRRQMDAALVNEKWRKSRGVFFRLDRAFPFGLLGFFSPAS